MKYLLMILINMVKSYLVQTRYKKLSKFKQLLEDLELENKSLNSKIKLQVVIIQACLACTFHQMEYKTTRIKMFYKLESNLEILTMDQNPKISVIEKWETWLFLKMEQSMKENGL